MSRSGGYKYYNIRCGSCIGKTLCGEPGDGALECDDRMCKKSATDYKNDRNVEIYLAEIRHREYQKHPAAPAGYVMPGLADAPDGLFRDTVKKGGRK